MFEAKAKSVEKRSKLVAIRVSERELISLKRLARLSGLSLSDYVRKCVLTQLRTPAR